MPCSRSASASESTTKKCDRYRCHVAIDLVLLASTGNSDEEKQDPRDANLQPHLEVHRSEAGVETGTHEEVIGKIPRHADLLATPNGDEISCKAHSKPDDHRNSHEFTKVIDDLSEAENMSPVQDSDRDQSSVPAGKSIAVIHKRLVSKRRYGEALLLISRHDEGQQQLESHERAVHRESVWRGERVLYGTDKGLIGP